ncbi:amino acid adenylation domain-containing protein [Speluncibacter jeojiensis]|uniref:Amino acid adenylation domain-containing protein n=1 Tax=Speluncibacter jeojiensis TaxID=2710754 RepID=A0A9X4REU8_9ACTN|nr:amino acid adenylation domain-containing protein [Corynebacteriales bacterium D3-21]
MSSAGFQLAHQIRLHAGSAPDSVAVRFRGQAMTYRELDERTTRVAAALRACGVGPEKVVGVAVPRGFDLIVAIVSIQKCGAAYLPLETEHPADRLSRLIAAAGSRHVLTCQDGPGNLALSEVVALLDLDTLARRALPADEGRAREPHPDNVAVTMFTSGSTGAPKCIAVTYRGLAAHFAAISRHYRLEPGDVGLAQASVGFDASLLELMLPLLYGATVCVVEPGANLDQAHLTALMAEERVTCAFYVPSVLNLLCGNSAFALPATVRAVNVGGEALTPAVVRDFRSSYPGVQLFNGYGPAETTIATTLCEVAADERATIPIGRPLDGVAIHVLDDRLQPVPDGGIGEMYISGAQVNRGYLGRSDLTAGHFVPDPFSADGARMYRTGDLATVDAHGELTFKGRVDHQVKLRGQRIELGEIEAVLADCPGARSVVVQLCTTTVGSDHLVGYTVPETGQDRVTFADQVLAYGRGRLPGFMVPTTMVVLDEFPLNASGKVDRKALPAPDLAAPRGPVEPPRNNLEKVVHAAFCSVLGFDEVGIDQNFFELGGTSLAAMDLLARIWESLGVRVPAAQFAAEPTVSGLAALCRPGRHDTDDPDMVLLKAGTGDPLFLIAGAGSPAMGLVPVVGKLRSTRPVYGIQAHGLERRGLPDRSIKASARRNIRLIENVQPKGPYLLGGYSVGGVIALEMARQLESNGESVAGVIALDTWLAKQGQLEPTAPRSEAAGSDASPVAAPEDHGYPETMNVLQKIRAVLMIWLAGPVQFNPRDQSTCFVCQAMFLASRHRPTPWAGRVFVLRAEGNTEGVYEWSVPSTGQLEIIDIPGNHLEIVRNPWATTTAEAMDDVLRRCGTGAAARSLQVG